MRAFAVLMMVQGHTANVLLADEFRNLDSFYYSLWITFRSFTAPIFMFTAGMIFTYLLKPTKYKFKDNPRIKKGVKRALFLIIVGYLLRYPTRRIIDFSIVTQNGWDRFLALDALHLIGLGLLAIILILYISEKINVSFNLLLIIPLLGILISSSTVIQIEWNDYLPQFFSSFLTKKYGSLFPIFPFLVYPLAGALLGNYLYRNEGIFLDMKFSFKLIFIGLGLILTGEVLINSVSTIDQNFSFWIDHTGYNILRIGYVLMINGVIALAVIKFRSIPKVIIDIGSHTLLVYVVHVLILYGCAWFPGIYKFYGKTFNPWETLISVVVMLILMFLLVLVNSRIEGFRKNVKTLRS